MRIEKDRDIGERPEGFSFEWDGREIRAYPGESILGALLADGVRTLREATPGGEPRGFFCGIGVCYECRVTVNGNTWQRACVTPATPGIAVRSNIRVDEHSRGEPGDE